MSTTYYRCEWQKRHGSVIVEFSTTMAEERPVGWYATQDEARKAEAARMTWLANELHRAASSLTRDRRGD